MDISSEDYDCRHGNNLRRQRVTNRQDTNTNAQWLGKQATNLGVNVKRITVMQDVVDEISDVIREAIERKPQFIITTGGLGPTFDDKTLQGIAKALNRKLEINQKALAMVKEKCEEYAMKRQLSTMIELTQP